jgi:hypothetical protein
MVASKRKSLPLSCLSVTGYHSEVLAQYSSTLRRLSDERALNTRHVDLEEVAKAIAKVLPGADKLNHEQ